MRDEEERDGVLVREEAQLLEQALQQIPIDQQIALELTCSGTHEHTVPSTDADARTRSGGGTEQEEPIY